MTILGIIIGVGVAVVTSNALAGFGAFVGTIILGIWFSDHADDLLV